jgi:hypothetical protein
MKNFKVFAETEIVEMENNLDDIELAVAAFNEIIADPDVIKAYISSNTTGELFATYDKYNGYYNFGGGVKIELWFSEDLINLDLV